MKTTSHFKMSITIEIERNKKAGELAGKYFDLGGDALTHVKDAECCPECKGPIEQSKYIAFVYCPSCQVDYPSSLCIENKRQAIKTYLKGLEEILNNKEDVLKNLELKNCLNEEHKKRVYAENKAHLFTLLISTKEWALFRKKQNSEGTPVVSKITIYNTNKKTIKRTLTKFFNFLRSDPRVNEEDEGIYGIKMSKDELMEIIEKKDQEIVTLKQTIDKYGLL
jgi:hypothetical protein